MKTIDNIIYERLLAHQGLSLKGVGSLCVIRRAALMREKRRVEAPEYEVVLLPEEVAGYHSLTDLVAEEYGTDKAQALRMYEEWLGKAVGQDQNIVIEGVGVISGGRFEIGDELRTAMNPDNGAAVVLKPVRRTGRYFLVLGLLILIAGCVWLFRGSICTYCDKGGKAPAPVVYVESTDSLKASQQPDTVSVREVNPDKTFVAGQSGEMFYVVLGVYSDPANADKTIAKALSAKPGLTISKIPYKDKTMVTMFASPDRDEATAAMRKLRDVEPDVWVYHRKAE